MTGVIPENFEDKNPSPFTTIVPKEEHKRKFTTLYGGLFQEVFEIREFEPYGHFTFQTTTNKITVIDTTAQTGFLIDPVAFAYDFGARMYDARLGRFLSIDPKTSSMPAWSPYSHCFNNPIMFVDEDGELPIIPLLLKAGANGAADMLMQAAMNYYFNPASVGDIEKSFGAVNYWQVSRSTAEGFIPWKTPGGRLGRAAGTAIGDVMVNAFNAGTDYSQEQALQDFAVGFIGDLAGGGMGELLTKYGAKNVAKGIEKMGFNAGMIRKATGYDIMKDYAGNLAKKMKGTVKEASGDGYTVVSGNYTIRMMYKGGQRENPYFRISMEGKGTIDATGKFSSDAATTHFEFTGDPTEQISKIINANTKQLKK